MKSTLSKLEPCLFPDFIKFLLIIDYLHLRMTSFTNFLILSKKRTKINRFKEKDGL